MIHDNICINESQIAKDEEELKKRQDESYCVYCKGQTIVSKYGLNNLCAVPLNFIYDCLKYGNYIAIIQVDNEYGVYEDGYYNKNMVCMDEQYVIDIFKADSIEAVKFVFDKVGDENIVHSGYIDFLSDEVKKYFKKRKNIYI